MDRLCVFCGSSIGLRPAYVAAARTLGRTLAERGIGVVYGGASIGLMGAVADAALAAGGEVIGVIPESLQRKEISHGGLSALHVVGSMHERKARMAELSSAFVALPGGIGTLEELFEVWTWSQLGLHAKPVAVLDVEDYYAPLLEFIGRMVDEGFLRKPFRELLLTARSPDELLDSLQKWRAPATPKWLGQGSA